MPNQRIIDALTAIPPAESAQTLRVEGAETIKKLLGCPAAEAQATLKDYEDRQVIKVEITPVGGSLSPAENMPQAKLKWAVGAA
jgi:hypothetical protein